MRRLAERVRRPASACGGEQLKRMGKREQRLRKKYARCCVALQRMERDVHDQLQKLYYAMQRRDLVLLDYKKVTKKLTKLDV
jgi:hypothetical protein